MASKRYTLNKGHGVEFLNKIRSEFSQNILEDYSRISFNSGSGLDRYDFNGISVDIDSTIKGHSTILIIGGSKQKIEDVRKKITLENKFELVENKV